MTFSLADVKTKPLVSFVHTCDARNQKPCGCWPKQANRWSEVDEKYTIEDHSYFHHDHGNNRAYRLMIRSLTRRQQRRLLRDRKRATRWLKNQSI